MKSPPEPLPEDRLESNDSPEAPEKPKGHGRLPHTVYTDANEYQVEHHLKPGEPCPLECGGKLYQLELGILVNIKGQSLASVDKYWLEKLRCTLCNEVFKTNIPKEACYEKYHPSFKSMLDFRNTTWPCRFTARNIFNHCWVFLFRPQPNGN